MLLVVWNEASDYTHIINFIGLNHMNAKPNITELMLEVVTQSRSLRHAAVAELDVLSKHAEYSLMTQICF